MKDTRGEGGQAGHPFYKRALTDPTATIYPPPTHTPLHPRFHPTNASGLHVFRRRSAEVGRGRGLCGLLIEAPD